MDIEEVSEILNSFGLLALLAPQHIFITDEKIYDKASKQRFRGLSPKRKRGVMVIGIDADESTVPHEWLHAMTGAGEWLAYPFGRIMLLRYKLKTQFPVLKRERLFKVKYKETNDLPQKYRGRVRHYVKI